MSILGQILSHAASTVATTAADSMVKDGRPREYKERARIWRAVMGVYMLICLIVISLHSSGIKRVDLLSGTEAMKSILNNDRLCFVIMLPVVGSFIFLMAKFPLRMKTDPMEKLLCYSGAGILIAGVLIFMFAASRNIYSDYKNPSRCLTSDYVLSESGGRYYLAFRDKGESAQLEIPEDVYEALSEGKSGDGGELFEMVTEAGYSNVRAYGSSVEIEYYFHSAIFLSAELEPTVNTQE